eukprot:jgi/Tetstr1/424411/TSEL_014969.t1
MGTWTRVPWNRLLPGGELEMGATVQTITNQPMQFTALAESSFSADVLRLYNRTLSPAEVPPGCGPTSRCRYCRSLLLHWRFDTPGVEVEEDYSGNGNHGRWAASPNLHQPHVYYQSKPEGVVEAWVHRPASVMSTAPTVGASRVSALAVPGAVVGLILADSAVAAGACTLLSLPTAGVQILTPPQGIAMVSLRSGMDANEVFSGDTGSLMADLLAGNVKSHVQFFQPMQRFPITVVNDAGHILLLPDPSFTGSVTFNMEYRWLSPYANESAVYSVEVHVQGLSSEIQMLPPLMSTNVTDRSIDLTLKAQSSRESRFQAEPTLLFHVGEGGERGEPLSRFSLETPTVVYDAELVPAFDPAWGPAWSSQMTVCPECCERHETCSAEGCAEHFFLRVACLQDPNSFPIEALVDGDPGTSYKPGCINCGRQWFVVGIQEPLYLYDIKIQLAGVQNHIVSIKGAESYAGADTEWVDVWQAETAEPSAMPYPGEWTPQLCPHYSTPMRWLRVEYNTDNAPSLPSFSNIKVEGSLHPHLSAVLSAENRLRYEPLKGVRSGRDDSLVAVASDCSTWSQELVVPIDAPGQAEPLVGLFGGVQRAEVPLRTNTSMSVNLAGAAAHLQRYLRQEEGLTGDLSPSEFQVVMEAVGAEHTGLVVFRPGKPYCPSGRRGGRARGRFAGVIVVAAVAIYFLKGKGFIRATGPPRQGEMVTLVTTDIQGSTTLWDAYPAEVGHLLPSTLPTWDVAHGIALHHECLRASLKACSGYEIATEGDSFKCAFRSPEDAICWSILSQMHLLCAQWNERIEDGGHSALVDACNWSNCEGAPVLSETAMGIIARLADSDGMESVRAELEKGLLMRPQFNPAKVESSTFCATWRKDKGPENCAAYGPDALLLPIFRGLRVRVGIHTGMADEVEVNPVTRRVVYGGQQSHAGLGVV